MSATSPATGPATDSDRPGSDRSGRASSRSEGSVLQVKLQHARWRHFGWAAVCLAGGVFLLLRLGFVGKLIGAALVAGGGVAAWHFLLTFLHEAGTIRLAEQMLLLPRGLCLGKPAEIPLAEVRHAFFLRRAVPWTRTGPVLVIEAGQRAYTYPRDWFASDSDPRRMAAAINRRIGR